MSRWSDAHKGVGNGTELGAVEKVLGDFAGTRTIMECLTGYTGDPKDKCTPCKIGLFYEFGSVKVCVNDPVRGKLGFATLDPEDGGLLESLTEALESGLDWRKVPEKPKDGFRRG